MRNLNRFGLSIYIYLSEQEPSISLFILAWSDRELAMRDRKFNESGKFNRIARKPASYEFLRWDRKEILNLRRLSIRSVRERYGAACAVKSRDFPSRLTNYGNAMRHVSLITRESVSCSTRPPTMPAAGIMNLNLSLNITSTHALLADGISTESNDSARMRNDA